MESRSITLTRRGKVSDEKQLVLKTMKEMAKPVKTGDIAKAIGMDSKVVSKIIKQLKEEGKVTSPKRCYYAPVD
jgi:Mn-dependent DtxR family transcriptional regulator